MVRRARALEHAEAHTAITLTVAVIGQLYLFGGRSTRKAG